ncbi:MAG TPA: hypothetical protein ENJ82_17295 [Bacteroidetes bacterium]|nr:hypothetical protein [Bacteroidota bacterium]
MQRFNLLFITPNANLRKSAKKVVSRVFRRSFTIESPSMEEAKDLIDKLNVDLVLVDMDQINADLSTFSKHHPNLTVWGLANNPRNMSERVHFMQNRVLAKKNFEQDMTTELKLVKKERKSTISISSEIVNLAAARSGDFKNFFKLIGVN